MRFTLNRNIIRWIIIISSFFIVLLILWNTYSFFQHFKSEERAKMKNWTLAYTEYVLTFTDTTSLNENVETNRVVDNIITDTSYIVTPMILIDSNNDIISYRNIYGKNRIKGNSGPANIYNNRVDSAYVHDNKNRLINRFKRENRPLVLKSINQTLYYGNSPLLNKLKYYPLALLLIIVLFAGVVFFFYKSSKVAEQNKLWTGMAKETAHQIGTPLSSLVGWTEILKSEQVNPEYITEIEKDIDRLQTITDRFSKIGSVPKLEITDIVDTTKNTYQYLISRSSKLIDFDIICPDHSIKVNLNEQLYSWTIENLVKNAIDAMKGKGQLKLELFEANKQVYVKVSDTGKGITKSQFTKIFEPGFTTKKRGWGLGLSLAKRIVEDYHDGKIKVLHSEIDKGTTIQIALKTA
ncbi:sensor histidine kinase [Winogradskyella immobilis]|uniref:histidine kinase n=1 Tax=Winogradskyella immobilis TaxID=2816852 RepID=A0ABS8EKK6_9FLAO|nr:HAMP domain-containing sensor histidine kinase [Winogradskyella immobilis]MCC1483758.1 HAMP domain-containing histidine kinase [Winogradskyella immobilis]MCG0015852.1 HAMP domain-containing histidine kinase [Winogradskyella immobilis]